MERYRGGPSGHRRRTLFRRWEATGLLLLVPVGCTFVPGVRGAPAVATVLLQAVASGDWRARFFALAPLLLAFLFALRAGGRLVRASSSYLSAAMMVTLSAVAVYLAFHLGLHLALRWSGAWPWWSPWKATAPGAAIGWGIILVVTAIRYLSRRASAALQSARHALHDAAAPAPDEDDSLE